VNKKDAEPFFPIIHGESDTMASTAIRSLFHVALSLCSLVVFASENDQALTIYGDVGVPLAAKTRFDAAGTGQRVRGLPLPAGLRMTDSGTVVGMPLTAGESNATAILVDSGNLVVARQALRFLIKNDAAAGRAAGSVAVASHLFALPNPASPGQSVMLSVAAIESAGKALTYSWNFSDGSTQDTSSGSVVHKFIAAGSYRVSVTIGNGNSVVSESTFVSVVAGAVTYSRSTTTKATLLKANAFETLQFTGEFDIENRDYAIGFLFSTGKKGRNGLPDEPDVFAKVPILRVESSSTLLTVVVPPCLKKSKYGSGKAALSLYVDGVKTDMPYVVQIQMPKAKAKLGFPTISYLRMSKRLTEMVKPTLAASSFIGSNVVTDCTSSISNLESMISTFESAASDKDKVALATLKQSDVLVLGILSGGTKIDDSTFAAACTAWLEALKNAKSSSDSAVQAAELAYINALLSAAGAGSLAASASSASRGFFSDAIGYTVGILTVTAAGVATVAVVVGGVTVTTAITTVMAPVAIAGVVIGVTAAATGGVVAITAAVIGTTTGSQQAKDFSTTMVKESVKITLDTTVNAATLNVPFVAKIIVKGAGAVLTPKLTNVITNSTDISNSTVNIQVATPQSNGSFTAGIIPSGSSYTIRVQGIAGHALTASVSGSDGYSASFSGTGTITSGTIPAGASGVRDTIICRDTVTGETQTFTFGF
jgi:PKD repeat protein